MSKFNEIISSGKPTLIDFAAEWCQPCKMMPPILKDVKKQLGDKVRILKIDVDKNPAIAQKHQIQSVPTMMVLIQSVPTMMVFKSGQIVFRQSGVMQSNQIVQMMQQFV